MHRNCKQTTYIFSFFTYQSELWGIDSNESTLYFRSGISSENTSGTGWQKIDLKCKRIHRVATHDQMDKLTDRTIDKDMNNNNQVSTNPTPSSEAPAEIVRDSQIFIVHRKLEEERPTLVIDDDIDIFNDQDFDSIYSTTESSSSTIQEPIESMNSETMNRRPSSKHYNSLNVEKYLINNDYNSLLRISEESTRTFDDYIEKYKEGKEEEEVEDMELKESRTDTMQSVSTEMSETMTASTLSEYQLEEDEKSIVSSQSYEPGVLGGQDLTVIGFKVCTANNFTLDMKAPNWFNNSKSVVDGKTEEVLVKLNDLKRNVILKDLRVRNIRETCNIDKISVDYENVRELFDVIMALFIRSIYLIGKLEPH